MPLCRVVLLSLTGCGEAAPLSELTTEVISNPVMECTADTTFTKVYLDFTLELFKYTAGYSEGENLPVSPLSVQLVLGMTANEANADGALFLVNILAFDAQWSLLYSKTA